MSLDRLFFVDRLLQPKAYSFGMPLSILLIWLFVTFCLLPWPSGWVSFPATMSFTFMSEDTRPVPLKVIGAKLCIQRNIHLVIP